MLATAGPPLARPCAAPKVARPHGGQPELKHSFFRASLGLAGFSATLVFQVRRAVSRRASSDAGVEAWRLLPIEIPSNMDAILRNRFNDVVYEELDDIDLSPFRTLAVIRLPVDKVPQVGQVQQLVLRHGSVAHLAMKFAAEKHGGFLGIAVDVVQAKYLPRGCVGAEVLKLSCEEDEDSVYVTLRGVSMLRIIDRVAMPDKDGITRPLMQEVLEYTDFEREAGLEVLLSETQEVERLFAQCGQLQQETGLFHAGDLAQMTLPTLAQRASENLKDVNLCGVKHAEHRGPVVASHAAISAFNAQKRADFLCDPFSSLRRLRTLQQFLSLMERVLTVKLHA